MDLAGKVVLVTGAAHGIGRATSRAFAAKGAHLALADIDADGVETLAKELRASGGRAIASKTDVSSPREFEWLIDRTLDELDAIDVMVSNAGVSVSGSAEATPLEDWRWIVDINMWPHVYAIRKLSPYFKERGTGHFVHVASAAGIFGTPGLPAYTMTKFAVFGLAESLAVSLHGSGIGVSVVCPLFVDTDIIHRGRIAPDPDLGLDEEATRTLGREMLRLQGIPPEKVGDSIVEAVETGRFLVLPHPEVEQIAQGKWKDPEGYIGQAAEVMKARRQLFGESI